MPATSRASPTNGIRERSTNHKGGAASEAGGTADKASTAGKASKASTAGKASTAAGKAGNASRAASDVGGEAGNANRAANEASNARGEAGNASEAANRAASEAGNAPGEASNAVGGGRGATGHIDDSGMVTVEAAMALCAFLVVFAMALAGMSAMLDQLRCTDAAREAARLVARGEPDRVADAVRHIAPQGAIFAVTTSDDGIVVAVRDPAPSSLLPGVHVNADAYAVPEPDADANTHPDTVDAGPHPATGPPSTPRSAPQQGSRPTEGGAR